MWALLPIKKFTDAKGRLSDVLSATERAEFSKAMAGDVIAVLRSDPRIERIIICSADRAAGEMARVNACDFMAETAAHDLNESVAAAAKILKAQGGKALVVVHADLPCLTAGEVGAFLAACRPGTVTIAPDRHRDGSNLLAWDLSLGFDLGYGPGSFERHCAEARRLGAGLEICALDGGGVDIDTAEDLKLLFGAGHCGPRTRAVLRGRQYAAA